MNRQVRAIATSELDQKPKQAVMAIKVYQARGTLLARRDSSGLSIFHQNGKRHQRILLHHFSLRGGTEPATIMLDRKIPQDRERTLVMYVTEWNFVAVELLGVGVLALMPRRSWDDLILGS